MDIPTIDYARVDDVGTLRLTGVIDIFEASSLHEAAVRAKRDSQARRVIIDVAGVVRLDTSAWQILLALRRGLDARDGRVEFRGASPALIQSATRIGIEFAAAA